MEGEAGYVGLERSLMVKTKTLDRLTKELTEANKKLKDSKIEADKKTFLKAQMPKMETEISNLKTAIVDLLEAEELDPRGEYFILAKKLTA